MRRRMKIQQGGTAWIVARGGRLDLTDFGLALRGPKALAAAHTREFSHLARKVEHGNAMERVSTAGAIHVYLDSDFPVFSLVLPVLPAAFLALDGPGFFISGSGSPNCSRVSK